MSEALLTPSKITAWLDCAWYLTLKNGQQQAELNHPGPLAELLREKGLSHEATCLGEFEARGLRIYSTPERAKGESFEAWVARVGNPMDDEWDVIYQFPMVHDGMRGIADFLVRVPSPTQGKANYRALRRQALQEAGEARSCAPALLLRRRDRSSDGIRSRAHALVARIRRSRVPWSRPVRSLLEKTPSSVGPSD